MRVKIVFTPKVILISETGAVPVERDLKEFLGRFERFRDGVSVRGGYGFQNPRTVAKEIWKESYIAVIDYDEDAQSSVVHWIYGDNALEFRRVLKKMPPDGGPKEVWDAAMAFWKSKKNNPS